MARRSSLLRHLLLPAALGALALAASACSSDDPAPYQPWTLETLTASEGFSIRIPEFEVASGQEVQDCYFVRVPDLDAGKDLWIDRVVTAINPGSHHLNVFRVKSIVHLDPAAGEPVDLGAGLTGTVVRGGTPGSGECWKSANWADWPIVANSQNSDPKDPYTDWKLPENVATRLTPGETLMIQTHYANATTQVTPEKAKVGINLHRFHGTGTPMELGTLFATQQSIRVCESNPTPSYSGTCRFPAGAVTITAVNGHFHSRGKRFDVFTWDGTSDTEPPVASRIYESNTWAEPPMSTGLDVALPSGGGVWWTCAYQWQEPATGCDAVNARDKQMANDCCYTFGPIVETSEHCNVFVYYYPKVDDVFCN